MNPVVSCRAMRGLASGILIVVAACLLAVASPSGDVERNLQREFVGKDMLLRGFYDGDDLRFDAAGKLTQGGATDSWTLALVHIRYLKLKSDHLEVRGERFALAYNTGTRQFEKLRRTTDGKRALEVKISAEITPGADEAQLRARLGQILMPLNEPFADTVPGCWRDYLKIAPLGTPGPAGPAQVYPPDLSGFGVPVYRVGGDVKPPHAVSQPDPEYSEAARKAKYQGTVVMAVVVGPDGRVLDVRIARPAGMGLDEKAVAAISTWRFEPATRDGKPVAVLISVDTSFRLY